MRQIGRLVVVGFGITAACLMVAVSPQRAVAAGYTAAQLNALMLNVQVAQGNVTSYCSLAQYYSSLAASCARARQELAAAQQALANAQSTAGGGGSGSGSGSGGGSTSDACQQTRNLIQQNARFGYDYAIGVVRSRPNARYYLIYYMEAPIYCGQTYTTWAARPYTAYPSDVVRVITSLANNGKWIKNVVPY